MKLSEAPSCGSCGKKLLHTQTPLCFKIEMTPLMLDLRAAQQIEGMTMMMGGALGIAEVLGPDPDVLKEMPETKTTSYLCTHCAARITGEINAE